MVRNILAGNAAPVVLSGVEEGVNLPVTLGNSIVSSIDNLPDALTSISLDAFGRNRVSDPVTLFDSQFHYDAQPLLWETVVNSGGTATHVPARASIDLALPTTNGAYVIRQSHRYMRYQPGKSQLIMLTGVIGAAKENVTKRVGYFDDNNGVFFESASDGFFVVVRSSTSGSPVDTRIHQSDWNLDWMNGNGSSGASLDFDKTQIFLIDLEWLGVGSVRFGFVVDGNIIYVHIRNNANSLTVPYMTTACLPLRYEIRNVGTTSSSTTMNQICSTVISEGGFEDDRGLVFSHRLVYRLLGLQPVDLF